MSMWEWADKHWVLSAFVVIIGAITASEAVTWIGKCFHELCKRKGNK